MVESKSAKSNFKAMLFDMDGIIFDSEILYFAAGTELLGRRKLTFTEELAQRMRGIPGIVAMGILRDEHALEESNEHLFAESEVIFESLLSERLQPIAGALELLAKVEEQQLPKAIVTSTRRQMATKMLELHRLIERFSAIVTSDDVIRGKPHPDIYLLACERMNVAPDEAVVFEDSFAGSKAAKAAGCACVLVPQFPMVPEQTSHVDLVAEHMLDPRLLQFCGL